MFSKPDSATPPRPASPNAGKSVLAHDLRINGDITTTGTVEIHGMIDGNVAARTLLLGPDGEVTGAIASETVEIKGKFEGRASTDSLTLRASAHVKADITYATVNIESGAQIDGRFTKAKTASSAL